MNWQWVTLVLSFILTAAIAGRVIASLKEEGLTKENYRGELLPYAGGLVIVSSVVVLLGPLAVAQEISGEVFLPNVNLHVLAFVLGVALLGLIDDLAGTRARGIRGHFRELASGRISTGVIKAFGTLGLALFAVSGRGQGTGQFLVEAFVLALAANFFNLLDLRPGRAIKVFILLGAGLWAGSGNSEPVKSLALFIGPVLAYLPFDLRARAMLGDTGSNLVGAVAGIWMVLTLSSTGLIVALGALVALTVYGEIRSINSFIEKTPLISRLDSVGR